MCFHAILMTSSWRPVKFQLASFPILPAILLVYEIWNNLIHRAADLGERKLHRPVVHRQSALPPPVLVAVVGPPKVGKTTLIRCLIKNFTGKNVLTIKGPVTIVSSKFSVMMMMACKNMLVNKNAMIVDSKHYKCSIIVFTNASSKHKNICLFITNVWFEHCNNICFNLYFQAKDWG